MNHSHAEKQDVNLVCLEAYCNFRDGKETGCGREIKSASQYPTAAKVRHYQQYKHLQPEFPCEGCLNVARQKWLSHFEDSMKGWTNIIQYSVSEQIRPQPTAIQSQPTNMQPMDITK